MNVDNWLDLYTFSLIHTAAFERGMAFLDLFYTRRMDGWGTATGIGGLGRGWGSRGMGRNGRAGKNNIVAFSKSGSYLV